jgi:hypothetical protein
MHPMIFVWFVDKLAFILSVETGRIWLVVGSIDRVTYEGDWL